MQEVYQHAAILLGQWWSLQELVSKCPGKFIHTKLDHLIAAATYHVKVSKGNQLAVGYTSVSIAFATFLATFIGILANDIFQKLRHFRLWKKVPKLNLSFKKLNTKQVENNSINDPAVCEP